MNVEDIILDASMETNTSVNEYWESKIIRDLNSVYKKVWRNIVRLHEDYFWNYWTTDIQEDVNEYAIQRKETTYEDEQWATIKVPWIAKVKKVYLINESGFSDELMELSDAQEAAWYRWYTIKDNHIILNWIPDKEIVWWLKLEGIQTVNDLIWDDEEDAIFPWHEDLQDFENVLQLGLKEILWRAKQDFDKANLAKQEYELALQEMIRYVAERVQNIYYTELQY